MSWRVIVYACSPKRSSIARDVALNSSSMPPPALAHSVRAAPPSTQVRSPRAALCAGQLRVRHGDITSFNSMQRSSCQTRAHLCEVGVREIDAAVAVEDGRHFAVLLDNNVDRPLQVAEGDV